jgi:kynurenine formamidase
MQAIFDLLAAARVYDLAQPCYVGMPHHPTHAPFLYGLSKQHGDFRSPGGSSSASDAIALGVHVGTHIDALCHFSRGGKLHGGVAAADVQSPAGGMRRHAVDTIPPLLRRGVLLDVAGRYGGPLPEDFEITPEHLDDAAATAGVEVRPGDVVLLRTGWAAYWREPARFINQVRGPGPGLPAARWLSSRGVFAAGSDTSAFERVPAPDMPVHVHLLVDSGIHLIECLNLEEAAAAGLREFLFLAAPLRIEGATASPIRPLAVVAEASR